MLGQKDDATELARTEGWEKKREDRHTLPSKDIDTITTWGLGEDV